jgi:hypothetical protein
MGDKITAVDWLIEVLTPSISLQQKYIDKIKKQAMQMEKEQIMHAYHADLEGFLTYEDCEKFYNQNYGQQEDIDVPLLKQQENEN